MKKAYLYWYKSSETSPTEYIYVVALSFKQARYFFFKNGYGRMYDYCYTAIDVLDLTVNYEVGTILGQYARL